MLNPDLKEKVLQTVGSIPKGKLSTYGDIATLAGLPRHARFVGTVLKNLPAGSKIPWHRVINSQGRSSFPAGSDAFAKQVQRLEAEGVILTGDKYLLRHYRWKP